jgi:hypothetical protein
MLPCARIMAILILQCCSNQGGQGLVTDYYTYDAGSLMRAGAAKYWRLTVAQRSAMRLLYFVGVLHA